MATGDDYVSFTIQTKGSFVPYVKSFERSLLVRDLKKRLVLITGKDDDGMRLQMKADDIIIHEDMGDDRTLGDLIPSSWSNKLELVVSGDEEEIEDTVPKYEMANEDYDRLDNSVKAFKIRNQLGRFSADAKEAMEKKMKDEQELVTIAKTMPIGSRCQVTVKGQPSKLGSIQYVGPVQWAAGVWVGVRYDEPLGKHDGQVEGKRYFTCPMKYGSIVKHASVTVGDFPEEDPFADD